MGQVLHGSARTTEAVRRAIQHSQESLRVLAHPRRADRIAPLKGERRPGSAMLNMRLTL